MRRLIGPDAARVSGGLWVGAAPGPMSDQEKTAWEHAGQQFSRQCHRG